MFNVLKSLVNVAPRNDIRYYLNAVKIVSSDEHVIFYATDGHLALKIKYRNGFNVSGNGSVVVCRNSLEKALKLYKKNDNVPLSIKNDTLMIDNLNIDSINGNYPDIERVLNKREQTQDQYIGLSIKTTLKAFKSLDMLLPSTRKQDHNVIRLEAGNAQDVLFYDGDNGEFEFTLAQMPARY